MSDLTEHLRKAGKVKTEKKTAASRATIAEARRALSKILMLLLQSEKGVGRSGAIVTSQPPQATVWG